MGAGSAQTVTNTLDDGSPGSLRSVVGGAAAGATVNFALDPANDQTIVLGAGALQVGVDDLTLDATAAPGLTLASPSVVTHLSLDADDTVVDDLTLRLIDVNQGLGTITIDGTMIFETRNDVRVSAQILDVNDLDGDNIPDQRGALVKEGSATLFLEAFTNYSAGTQIRAGTLQGTGTSIQGNYENGSTLIFEVVPSGTYRDVIQDYTPENGGPTQHGSVEKTGTGELLFTNAQLYTGGTFVRAGTLSIDSRSADHQGALAPSGDVTIDADATLRFELAGTDTYTGAWTNAGLLVLAGDEEASLLDLSGADANIDGRLTIDRGTVALQSEDLSAHVMLERADTATGGDDPNGSVLRLIGSGTVSGDIEGPGRLEVAAGTGTVTLTGTNTFTGTTSLESGTLVVSSSSLTGNAMVSTGTTLVFEQSGNGTYGGLLSGEGFVEKRSGGSLELLGAHDDFEGSFQVSAGELRLSNTTLPGDFLLDTGATLTGSGALGSSNTFRGRVTPSGGNLRVAQATFASTSTLAASVQQGVPPDRIVVETGGELTSEPGATLELTVGPGDYSAGQSFLLIDGEAGASVSTDFTLAGVFDFVSVTFVAGTTEDLIINVEGSITPENLLAAANSPNQRAVAGALADVIVTPPGGGSAEQVRNAFFGIPSGGAAPMYDDLGAESIASFTRAALASAQRFERGLHRRVRDLSWGSREAFTGFGVQPGVPGTALSGLQIDPGFGAHSAPFSDVRPAPGMGAWMDGWGQIGSVDGDGNSHDSDTDLAGVTLGVDAQLGSSGLLGAAIGYTYADLEVDGQDTRSDAHGVKAALYGGFTTPRWYLSAAARFGWARNDSERRLAVGTLRDTADADFDSLDYGLGIEAAANLTRFGLVVVQGVASFDWTAVEREDFRESGSLALSALNLAVDDESIDSLRSGLGLRATLRYPLDGESEMVPELRVRWLHEFGDDERLVNARFLGANSGPGRFEVAGVEAATDSFQAGFGWSVSLTDRVRAHANYDAIVDADALAHEFGLAVRVRY